MMKVKLVFTSILLWMAGICAGQNGRTDTQFEFQAYPTGLISGLRFEGGKGRNTSHLRLGFNWMRHGDNGKHEDERGIGFGFTFGYKRYLLHDLKGLFAGIRSDIWFNEMKWKDNIGLPDELSGTTELVVLQPTLEAGWLFELNPKWVFAPSLAFGYEVNVDTDGSPTGEGPVMLLGVMVGYHWFMGKRWQSK